MDEGQKQKSQQQGIFSTPELTVDKENLVQNNPEEAKTRVASFFANTDASQQAQKLNNAMATTEAQPATEDVVINNGPKKRSKMPVILALAAIVVVAVVAIAAMALNQPNSEVATAPVGPKATFDAYYNLLTQGPELDGDENSSEDWFLYGLPDRDDMSQADKDDYVADLLKKYQVFEASSTSDSSLVTEYGNLLRQVAYGINPTSLTNAINEKYISENNLSSVHQMIDNLFPEQSNNQNHASSSSLSNALRKLALAELDALTIYVQSGCVVDGELEISCQQEVLDSNNALSDLLHDEENYVISIRKTLPFSKEQFSTETKTLKNSVEEDNHE